MSAMSNSVVFVDANVSDLEHLLGGILPTVDAHVLASNASGIDQITDYLKHHPASTVHIVSHGAPGRLLLGNSELNLDNLDTHTEVLSTWFASANATLLLYGCNVAAGDAGAEFIEKLHTLTGASIAASNSLTGSSTLGGDWKLEVKIGQVKATVPFSPEATQAYTNVLEIKVAVVVQPGDNSTGFIEIVNQLNNDTYFDFTATLVNSSQVDTAAELNAYNAVIIGNSGSNSAYMDPTFASALRSWVEAGGGLVSAGWIVFGDLDNPDIDAVVPVNTVQHNYNAPSSVVFNGTAHPIVDGVTSFLVNYAETPANGVDPDSTVLATTGGKASVVVANKGLGKSVYLGPVYSADPIIYSPSSELRTGNADRLLEQAVAWVATPTNSAPTVNLSGSTVAYTENDAATLLNTGATVTDTDSPDFVGGNLTVNIQAGATADDRLAIRNQGTGVGQIGLSGGVVLFGGETIGTFTGGTGTTPLVISFNSVGATPAAVQALLSNITYSNVSEAPSTTARTVQFLVNDGDGGTSTAVTRTVNVTAVNDAPENTVPGAQTIDEDGALVFSTANGNTLSISDPDAGSNPVQVTLTGTNGTFSLSGINGLSFSAGDGTADGTMTFTGTLASINAALNGLSFRPTANFNGAASLALTTNDQGFSGGAALIDSDTINITVNAVNDAPTLSGGGNDAERVAILGAPGDPTWLNDVVAKVQSTGLFTTVDSFNVSSVTPTLAQLLTYDSVLVFSNAGFADPTTLGNNLADYVDAGGGVVVNTFAVSGFFSGSRWVTGGYSPLLSGSPSSQAQSTLGTIFDPGHPVLQGVTSFNGGSSSYYNTGTVNPNATVVANWSSNAPLVIDVQSFNGGIVGLNFFAPSSDVRSDLWTASTDGEWLMGNALEYVDGTGTSEIEVSATEDDASFTVDLLAGATDADGDTLNVSNLAVTGGNAAGVTVNGNSLTVNPNAYTSLAAGAKETITYTYNIVDGNSGSVAQTATITIDGVDDAPTAATLTNTVTTLTENIDTSAAIKLADITITDVDGGTNNITLTGEDAASFTIINNALYLRAGVTLNFEAKSSYSVNVVVDAPGVGENPDFTLPFTLTVVNANEAPTGGISITGTPTQGETLSANIAALVDPDGIPGAVTYQWQADGADIDGATGNTLLLTQAQVGKAITVVARYTDGFGQAERVTSDPTTAVANVNDDPTGTVTIDGLLKEGETLTANTSTLADPDGLGVFTYDWAIYTGDGTLIAFYPGDPGGLSTFTLTADHVGRRIQVSVTYTDQEGTLEIVDSDVSAVIVPLNNAPTGAVTLSGIPKATYLLTADASAVQDIDGLGSFSYQWQQSTDGTTWSNIAAATGATFRLTAGQVGQQVRAQVSYTDNGGTLEVVESNPTAAIRAIPLVPNFNGDTQADIAWRHRTAGRTSLWYMDGTSLASGELLSRDAGSVWSLRAVDDFDRDGSTDLVWQNSNNGQAVIWRMDGNDLREGVALPADGMAAAQRDPNWQIVATGDFNGDDQADLLWRNRTTGDNAVWFMNGTTRTGEAMLDRLASQDWELGAVDDFTKNGEMEILWRHRVTGQNVVWYMEGTTRTGGEFIESAAAAWRMAGAADFNGDGNLDIMYRHRTTASTAVWFMEGTTRTGGTLLDPVAVDWQPVI